MTSDANVVPEVPPEILDFYTDTVDESQRLTSSADGALELVRTQEILRRHLPAAPASILDVGGGPGIHAQWLATDGYTVHIVDPVARHVAQAPEGVTAEIGDARKLSAPDHSQDVVLLLGPLYHLLKREDRDQALAEALRVAKPGALIASAAIGRYASLFEHVATTWLGEIDRVHDAVRDIIATGIHAPGRKGFTAAYFHTAESLAEELTSAGVTGVEVVGIEGPTWGALKATEVHTKESLQGSALFRSALAAARLAEPYPELLAASSHMLAIGHAPA